MSKEGSRHGMNLSQNESGGSFFVLTHALSIGQLTSSQGCAKSHGRLKRPGWLNASGVQLFLDRKSEEDTYNMANLRGCGNNIGNSAKHTTKQASAARLQPPKINIRSHRLTTKMENLSARCTPQGCASGYPVRESRILGPKETYVQTIPPLLPFELVLAVARLEPRA